MPFLISLRRLYVWFVHANPVCFRRLWLLMAFFATGSADAHGVPVVESHALTTELAAVRPQLLPCLRFDDERYVVVDHRWLQETFLPYFRTFLNHVHANTSGEGYDCDDYTFLFRAKLVLSNVLAGGARAGAVPCGRLIVDQNRAFAGVPGSARARHALVLVRTEQGWFVVEPQTCAMTPLAAYPNLATIAEILF